ncbi:MAG: 4Fe-4S binding protein [Thermaerobacter sp.]|nr:4Fe-4S binding protein [Thermaerobacter sp.]
MARRVESVGGGRDVTRRRRHNSLAWGALRGAVLVALFLAVGAGYFFPPGRWNFAPVAMWIVFWPTLIVLSLLFLNRLWCTVCPLRTVARLMDRGPGVPAWVRRAGGVTALASFLLGFWILRPFLSSPPATASYLSAWLVLAAGVGFLWGEGAWCRALCPIGLASGVLAAAAPLALHADAARCRGCREKPCRGACPTGEFPGRAASSRHCTLCLACVPACPSGSLALRGRWPGRELLRARPELSAALMGVAIVGIWQLWMWLDMTRNILTGSAARALAAALPALSAGRWAYLLCLAVGLGAAAGIAGLAALAGARVEGTSWRRNLARFGPAYVFLVVPGSLAHNLLHNVLGQGGTVEDSLRVLAGLRPNLPAALFLPGPVWKDAAQALAGPLAVVGLLAGWAVLLLIARQREPGSFVRAALPHVAGTLALVLLAHGLAGLPRLPMRM